MVTKNDTQQNPCSQSVPSYRHHNTREEGLEEGGGGGGWGGRLHLLFSLLSAISCDVSLENLALDQLLIP